MGKRIASPPPSRVQHAAKGFSLPLPGSKQALQPHPHAAARRTLRAPLILSCTLPPAAGSSAPLNCSLPPLPRPLEQLRLVPQQPLPQRLRRMSPTLRLLHPGLCAACSSASAFWPCSSADAAGMCSPASVHPGITAAPRQSTPSPTVIGSACSSFSRSCKAKVFCPVLRRAGSINALRLPDNPTRLPPMSIESRVRHKVINGYQRFRLDRSNSFFMSRTG